MSPKRQKIYRIIAAYLLLNLIAEYCIPVAAFALTNGPGQPEFQSFEPAGSSEMVNLFTGDFSYNIPLMTVPGPNGGYPINLAYHAGIGMEQEASWVGLGWNINAGAINRSMRGLPDDFKGDQVIKKLHFRPSNSAVFNLGRNIGNVNISREILGFNQFQYGAGVQVYYNNYRGIGFQFAGNFALASAEANSPVNSSPLRLNLTSSSDGVGVNLAYSITHKVERTYKEFSRGIGASLSWGSREGIQSFNFSFTRGTGLSHILQGIGAGISFSSSGYVPISNPEIEGFIANTAISIGTDTTWKWSAKKVSTMQASYNRSWIKNTTQSYDSYGYLYNEYSNAIYNDLTLEDINRDKDVPPARQSKTLGVPIATYDMFNVSAQGMGGSFRPYRSDMGIYTEPRVTSTIYGGTVGAEWGAPAVGTTWTKFGVDGSYVQSQSYSGMWHNHFWNGNSNQGWNDIDDYVFQGLDSDGDHNGDYAYQPFYFKMAGELTSSPANQLDFIGGTSAVRFKLEEPFESGNNFCPRPEILSDGLYTEASSINLDNSKNHRASREKTVTRNIYRTDGEMEKFPTDVPVNLFDMNDFPALDNTVTGDQYAYGTKQDHHVAEFTETGADGSRYVYGIPVYAYGTKEVMFSKNGFATYPTNYSFSYTTTDASLANNETGTDELYSSTETPGYAESYLLTEVISPDYVDVTGDGPTEDDMGYYTKFNYVLSDASFKWRAPYYGGVLNSGHLSNVYDDKLSYQCGTKEVYLLHSIETKTHVACFVLNETARKDAHGAIAEYVLDSTIYHSQVATADKMWSLDHVSLYSKADPDFGTADATPIKSVYFNYNYTLCPGVVNNELLLPDSGKLTLRQIYFTYRDNEKGKLSPYTFDYGDPDDNDINPDYDPLGNDRWGTYKKQESGNYRNNENPYTDQKNRTEADQSAAAWCLKQITLPSGSIVDIEYEADDYAYVQDKPAMQMCKVIGFGSEGNSNPSLSSDVLAGLGKKKTQIYFELNEPINYYSLTTGQKQAMIAEYINNIDDMYFKMFLGLKSPHGGGTLLYDYVDGFCKISFDVNSYGVVDEGVGNMHRFAYLTVERVDRDDYPNIVSPVQVNPIQKAAWQHLYLERSDLFANPNIGTGAVGNLVTTLTGIFTELPRAVAPYISANVSGWADALDINTTTHECAQRPSYIRLNSPDGRKVGGGHRVHRIMIRDAWDVISSDAGEEGKYGQIYSYALSDGRSSGVASYEPLMGGEENSMCVPLRYNSDNLVKKDEAFYVMEPIAESYYPAPIVGYSRVIVSSVVKDPALEIDPEAEPDVTVSRTGITEYEFYTAKDYPVEPDRTDLQKTWFPVPVVIPFVGSISYNMRGFSQGYSVVLNDMHGKLKSVATYPSYANLIGGTTTMPTRRVFYKYNGEYGTGAGNRLSSTVDVLTSDGVYSQENLGETYDFFFDLRQHSNETQELGAQFNMEVNGVTGALVPTFMLNINISKSLYRSAVAMKVIYRTGILTEVETMDDGAKSTARNLMFDAETGAPLLTVVENEFERPVYTYNFAAHWAYEGMQGAYKNQGARFGVETTDGSGILDVTDGDDYFFPGDEVMYIPDAGGAGTMLWVEDVTGDDIHLIEEDGGDAVSYAAGTFIIHRSGRRNLQSVSNGVIVSLSNPVTDRNFPLFEAFNACTTSITANPTDLEDFYVDCATGEERDIRFSISDDIITIIDLDGGCEAFLTFPDEVLVDLPDAFTWDLHYSGGIVTATKTIDSELVTHTLTWTDNSGCFQLCMDDVLHASAVRFAENWSSSTTGHQQEINFADAGLTVTSTNDYKYGLRGVWRTHSNYLYQVDRKQSIASASKTDISKDGTYDNFVLYNWEIAAQDNTLWAFVSAVTRYSPYGYALETRDALGIYSSVMYGYDNTKQTAAAANSQYFEMGFDGFEDYSSGYTGHGHLLFVDDDPGHPTGLDALYAHTGKSSYGVQYNGDAVYTVTCNGTYPSNQQYFEGIPGQEYFFSVWARSDDGGIPTVIIDAGTPVIYTPDESTSAIEGWRKIEGSFIAPSGILSITLSCQTMGQANFDDFRVQPFKSAMTSYVYDPQTHWLMAQLDNRNYATFYNYDEEGALVQVKQETEKGIFTVQTSRGNIIRQ